MAFLPQPTLVKSHSDLRLKWLFAGLLLLPSLAGSQPLNHVPDSLARYLKTAPPDTNQVRAAYQYVWWLLNPLDNPERADSLLQCTQLITSQLHDPLSGYQLAVAFGRLRMRQNQLTPALTYFQQADQIVNKAHLPPQQQQQVLSLLGQVYYYQNQFPAALRYFLAAIKLTETYGLTAYVTRAYVGVSQVMMVTNRQPEARYYAHKALALAYQDTDKTMIFWAENTIVSLLENPHTKHEELVHLFRALPYAERYANKTWKAALWGTISDIYMELNQYANARRFLKKSERLLDSDKTGAIKMNVYDGLAHYYQHEGKYQLAEAYFLRGARIARQVKQIVYERTQTQALAGLYAQTHQYRKAYLSQLKLAQLNDSLLANQATRRTQELIARYENEQKEARLKLLHEQHQRAQLERNASLGGALLLLLLGGALGAWLLNRARLRRVLEAGHLRQQIAYDLHDEVGSTLSSIALLSGRVQGLLAQNRLEAIPKAIDKINTDARQVLDSLDELIWSINPGNDPLHGMALRWQAYAQPLMEAQQIHFSLVADPALAQLSLSMPVRRHLYLIGKEAINNLVKHSQATHATVHVRCTPTQLQVLIEDDGQGFEVTPLRLHTGQQSMQHRARAIGGVLRVGSAPGQGTRLELTVPYG